MGGGATEAQGLAVAKCVSDIEVADFVALDFEFSGLFLNPEREKQLLSLNDYFDKCAESIPQFLPLQLGVCCARQKQGQPGHTWELRTHEFDLWPQSRRVFAADLQSLRFLRAHGFDFNAFFTSAYLYTRLPPLEADKETRARLPPAHATNVIAALRRSRVPLIFHNGFLDLLHMHDKFLGDLPDERAEFGEAWVSHFPLLFDTRLLAQEGRFQVLKHSGGLSLEELHKHLLGVPNMPIRFDHLGPLGTERSAHGSSGHDARLTAEVFLMEMDMWLRADVTGGNKRKRKAAAKAAASATTEGGSHGTAPDSAAAPEPDNDGWTVVGRKRRLEETGAGGLTSPSLLETHEVCRRFHNRLAIVGAAPGCLDLGRPPALQTSVAPLPAPGSLDLGRPPGLQASPTPLPTLAVISMDTEVSETGAAEKVTMSISEAVISEVGASDEGGSETALPH